MPSESRRPFWVTAFNGLIAILIAVAIIFPNLFPAVFPLTRIESESLLIALFIIWILWTLYARQNYIVERRADRTELADEKKKRIYNGVKKWAEHHTFHMEKVGNEELPQYDFPMARDPQDEESLNSISIFYPTFWENRTKFVSNLRDHQRKHFSNFNEWRESIENLSLEYMKLEDQLKEEITNYEYTRIRTVATKEELPRYKYQNVVHITLLPFRWNFEKYFSRIPLETAPRIIVNQRTKKAYDSYPNDADLLDRGYFQKDVKTKSFPMQTRKGWCKRNQYDYSNHQPSEEELA